MKKLNFTLLITFLLAGISFSQTFEYISPKENSALVSLSTNIILKSSQYIDRSSLSPDEFVVIGSKSGNHSGVVKLSDDNKTILFFPDIKFAANEVVNVTVKPGIKTISGNGFSPLDFQFTTTPLLQPINPEALIANNKEQGINSGSATNTYQLYREAATNTLPADFPLLKVDSLNNPWDGKIFIANKPAASNSYGSYLIIADNNGNIVKYKKFSTAESNFRVLPNGELMTSENGRHIILDTTLAPIDTFKCGNGYTADSHDFVLLPNGHALLFASDPQPVDMSKIVIGGQPDATVIGAVVQELDDSKNVIFQWRSFDYIPITDSYYDLTQKFIPYVHGNALDVDNDGNILFSLRYCSSIVKINRETGDVMWILGGKENQFQFFGEHSENAPTFFSNQHNVTALPDGDLLLFDNGDDHKNSQGKPYSRGVEYKLDQQAMTATMVWEYDHNKSIYTSSGGSIQRLPNGNTLIGWSRPPGGGIYHPTLTEVSDTNIVMEMSFQAQDTLFSYRAYKFLWLSQQPGYSFIQIDPLQGNIYPNPVNPSSDTTIGVYVKFDSLNAETYSEFHIKRYNYSPVNPTFSSDAPIVASNYINFSQDSNIHFYNSTVTVQLKFFPGVLDPANTMVYKINQANGHFEPVATSYDPSYVYNGVKNLGKVLMFNIDSTYFDDLLFGVPRSVDSAYAPVPFSPGNSDTISTQSVVFRWGTYGILSSFHLQVATDPLFNNIVIDSTEFKTTVLTDTSLTGGNFYYWRVNNTNSSGTSNWSDTANFYISTTVGVEDSKNTLPQNYYLSQNYPNPFNPSTVINYEIPKSSIVTLKVYDVLGREVSTFEILQRNLFL